MKKNRYKQMTDEQKEIFLICFYEIFDNTVTKDFVDYYIHQNKKLIKDNMELLEEIIRLKGKLKEKEREER